MLIAAKREALMGFDITTAEGWASVGLAPEASVVLDAGLTLKGVPVPMAFFRVTDEAKLLAFIKRKLGPEVHPRVEDR